MRKILLALPLVALAACSTTTTGSTDTHVQAATALQTAYTTAHAAEVAYCATPSANTSACATLAKLDSAAQVQIALFVAEPNNTSVETQAVVQMAAFSGQLAVMAAGGG